MSRVRPNAGKENNDQKWTFNWQVACAAQYPFLLLDFENDGLVVLFDCGVRSKVKTILKLKHLFISNAHIDHLIGFIILLGLFRAKTKPCILWTKGINDDWR